MLVLFLVRWSLLLSGCVISCVVLILRFRCRFFCVIRLMLNVLVMKNLICWKWIVICSCSSFCVYFLNWFLIFLI